MNLIINEGDVVSLHKQPVGLFASHIREIISPLKKTFGIEYFGYGQLVGPGEESYLSTHPDFSEDFYNHQLYKLGFISNPKVYKTGYYLFDAFPPNAISDFLRERYHLGHFLVFLKQHGDFCEKFFFGTSIDNTGIGNAYLNQLDTFRAFTECFKERAAALIQESALSKTICPAGYCQETLLTPQLTDQAFAALAAYSPADLTAKEKESAFYLSQCLSLKEVSEKMSISPRTLEKHIAKLKLKLNCKNMTSLVVTLRKYYEFDY